MSVQPEMLAQSAPKQRKSNRRFYFVIFLILCWYVFTIWYQANLATDDPRKREWAAFSVQSSELPLTLELSYPRAVSVNPNSVAGQPMSLWLIRSSTAQSSLSAAPVSDVPYLITIRPFGGGLAFVNKDGVPIAPETVITPASDRSAPWIIYLRRTPDEVNFPAGVSIAIRPLKSDALVQPQLFSVPIDVEQVNTARLRQVWALLLSPTAPVVGLFITLAWKWYDDNRKRQDEAQKAGRFAEIEGLHQEIEHDNFREAIPRLLELQARYRDDSDAAKSLAEVRRQLHNKPWQTSLLDEAARLLVVGNYDTALRDVGLVLSLAPDSALAVELGRIIRATRQRADQRQKMAPSGDSLYRSETIMPLLQVYRAYPGLLDRIIGKLLTEVIPQDADRHLLEFQRAPYARDLLNVRDLAEAIDKTTPQSPEAQKAKMQLLQTRQELWFRIIGASGERQDWSGVSPAWLERAELAFNPFGPERAEDDPWLPDYAVDLPVSELSGPTAVWLSSSAGSGRTTLALLLAYYCYEPICQPREPYTFPVYLVPTAPGSITDTREWLGQLALATSRALIRYLAVKPLHFLDLPVSRQQTIARLLLTCLGTSKQLASAFHDTGLDRTEGNLVKTMSQWNLDIHAVSSLGQQDWLDLLKGTLPEGFERSYIMIDFPSSVTGSWNNPAALEALLNLPELLHPLNIYLKVFAPQKLIEQREHIARGYKCINLRWSEEQRANLLSQRLQQAGRAGPAAGRDSLDALCDVGAQGSEVDKYLIESAQTPRDVIHWGNRLLCIHTTNAPDVPYLSEADIEQWKLEIQASNPRVG
jgi:hypothetical protein